MFVCSPFKNVLVLWSAGDENYADIHICEIKQTKTGVINSLWQLRMGEQKLIFIQANDIY